MSSTNATIGPATKVGDSLCGMCDKQLQDTINDIDEMLHYALAEGLQLPETARKQLAELCYGPSDQDKATLPSAASVERYNTALEVHGALSRLIAPATPTTLLATPRQGYAWRQQWPIYLLLVFGVLCLIAFVFSAAFHPATSPTDPIQWWNLLMLFTAAGLGASFYGLYTAYKYITERTYDPIYNLVYIIRFVLGLTSGTILGYFGHDLLKAGSQLSSSVLAMLGGYSAEAVSQILQRMADTLVTLVRGNNDDVLKAKLETSDNKNKQLLTQCKGEAQKPLQAARDAAVAKGADPSVVASIQKAIDALLK